MPGSLADRPQSINVSQRDYLIECMVCLDQAIRLVSAGISGSRDTQGRSTQYDGYADTDRRSTFRPAPGGFVYREPYRWPFRQARHYLVDTDQKAALLAITVPRRPILWQAVLWGTLCLMVAASCIGLWLYTGHDTPTALDILAVAVLTIGQVTLGLAGLFWWKRRRLRPLLATLTPTDLQISQAEMRAAAINAMSGKQLVLAGVSGVFASTAMLINAALQLVWRQPVGLLWLTGSMIFAGFAWYHFKQLAIRAEKH